uniref:Uncharacterized protein n=1 Tax=Octopus bimaculoides TaxID=37653 RepID=A0A0L8FQZ7_OCTBM
MASWCLCVIHFLYVPGSVSSTAQHPDEISPHVIFYISLVTSIFVMADLIKGYIMFQRLWVC